MTDFSLQRIDDGGVLIFVLGEALDHETESTVVDALTRAVAHLPPHLIVRLDLSRVAFLDSSGIRARCAVNASPTGAAMR